jgi:hypothetical protein
VGLREERRKCNQQRVQQQNMAVKPKCCWGVALAWNILCGSDFWREPVVLKFAFFAFISG